ncbi:hypothetical protein [Streptomyces sp. CAU 1734]|uniref:hypothetical protein n=1 Tax=Streptomyces sp. CAU 1734 TaxID=3140360 RepID=UPI00326070A1
MAATPVELTWYACDLRTGGIIEELSAVTAGQALSRRLGTYTTTTVDLALPGAARDWESATDPGRTLLVAVDRAADLPLWAGIVITRDGGSSETLALGLATPERYLDSRYPGTHGLVQQDQADVITALLAPVISDDLCFVMDAPPTGVLMDYTVEDGDDRSDLSCLQELMGADGGPEWAVDVEWAPGRTGFVLPIRVRPAIGTQNARPEAVFDFPGCVSSYTLAESYEQGKGATVVVARGEGEGAARLTSGEHVATELLAAGWPRWVHRFTPASGLTDPAQLDAHAARALALMQRGAAVWTIDATASASPRLGRDWVLGDSVRLSVAGSLRHPAGADTIARAWGWELDPDADTVRPILVED